MNSRTQFLDSDDTAELARHAMVLSGAAGVAIALQDEDGVFRCRERAGEMAPDLGAPLGDEGVSRQALVKGETLVISEAEQDTRVNPQAVRSLGARSMVLVPIKSAEHPIGLLSAFSPLPFAFDDVRVQALVRTAEQIEGILRARDDHASKLVNDETEPNPVENPNDFGAPSFETFSERRTHDAMWYGIGVLAGITVIALGLLVFGHPGLLAIPRTNHVRAETPKPDAVETAAEKGDAAAQYEMAMRYLGSGNDSAAFTWLDRSAAAGNSMAQETLGDLLSTGRGASPDLPQADAWYIMAFLNGNAVARDKVGGLDHLMSADQTGAARLILGHMFEHGVGTARDLQSAYCWMLLAREVGNTEAEGEIQRLSAEMSPAEKTAAKGRASDWIAKHREAKSR